jgi:hypothetical protein
MVLALLQARTAAYPKLNENVPIASLFYLPVLVSVFGVGLIQLAFQLYFFVTVRNQPFYVSPVELKPTLIGSFIMSYEDTVLFLVSNF